MHDTIFVYYHRGTRTGGPEALHQLVDSLRRQGQDAYLVPVPRTERIRRIPEYGKYDAPEAPCVIDVASNAVVVPEVEIANLPGIEHCTAFKWWLSIDNAVPHSKLISDRDAKLGLGPGAGNRSRTSALIHSLRMFRMRRRLRNGLDEPVVNLAQSHYAWSYLYTLTRQAPSMLSDYTPDPGQIEQFNLPMKDRRKAVCFNPKKSGHLAARIATRMPDVEFIPIMNMSRVEVYRTLGSTAVYLDLGNHPGKDRIPREAALAGAVVAVSMRGSAAYSADVPLPLQHKIAIGDGFDENAVQTLTTIFADLEYASELQSSYRSAITSEKACFDAEVQAIFINGLRGFDSAEQILTDRPNSHTPNGAHES